MESSTLQMCGIGVCGTLAAWIVYNSFRLQRPVIPASHWSRKPGLVGHRGVRIPESPTGNTLSAFQLASKDAVALELDVQITVDDKVVVFHDLTTGNHLLGPDRIVMEMTLEELQSREFAAEADRGQKVPTLEDVLKLAKARDMNVLVELKGWSRSVDLCKQALDVIRRCDYEDRVMIISFGPTHIYNMRVQSSSIPTALIVCDGMMPHFAERAPFFVRYVASWLDGLYVWAALTPSMLPTLLGSTTLAADYHMFTPAIVKAAAEQGLSTDAWTVNSQEDATALAAMGVTFITTDLPTITL